MTQLPIDQQTDDTRADTAGALDLVLTGAALNQSRRFRPGWETVRLARQLGRRPRKLALRGNDLLREYGQIAIGASTLAPSKGDRRFADPAWTGNPVLHRVLQAYLATAQAVETVVTDVGDLYGGSARTDPDRVLRLMGDNLRPASTPGYIHQLMAGAGWVSLPWLPLIRQQTLILAGEDDPIIPLINARVMHRLLPHARLHIHEGGHVALVTEADRLAPVVAAFLNDHRH